MKYNGLIGVNQDFQTSVNLEYDLNKTGKVQSYIPTEQSVKVLGAFLRSYYFNAESQNRATVLIGPYGRGKSHLLLVLSALTSLDLRAHSAKERKKANEIQMELCEKIERVDKEVGALAKAIVESKIRTLPVIINSNSTDINQSFLVAINDALVQANLHQLLPTTYFDSAIAVMDKWEAGFPDAYAKLKKELKHKKTTADELRIGLRQFNQKSYRLFCKCYPEVAAGTEFNPLTNMDVVKLYMAVTAALKEQTSYCGITIIFDEFSKFLEANLEKSKMLNFKIIQDMAEAASRSKEAQLHFTCITHKDILDYSSSDSFKTVEGRFKKVRFVASSEQSYELIANAIIKKDPFAEFYATHADAFKHVADRSSMTNLFSDLSSEAYTDKLVYGCFPLSPLSSFALLHVSELVGQNERTLFISPYHLVWNGDFYYVVGFSNKHNKVVSFRVDRIATTPKILNIASDPVPNSFDLAKYTKEVFSMYDGKTVVVNLKCDNSLMKVIIDRFGEDVTVLAYDMTSFRLKIEVSASPTFYGWVFGFGGKIQILGPKQVKDEYAMMVSSAQSNLAK